MNPNLNHYYNKQNNQYIKLLSDISDNNIFLLNNDELNYFRYVNNLHTSNDIIYSNIYSKNTIFPNLHILILIFCLQII